jgi:CRISPR-associated protein (TIGR02710 family)
MTIMMLMSLGGSPEPLQKSIREHQPEKIVFLASHDSILKAGEILSVLSAKPSVQSEITENPNIMFECYKAARKCVERVRKTGIAPEDVLVDYTGGTKVMTAALILATIGEPYQFNYVGGELRNKDGLGTVISGHERMFPEMSPWSIFAEEERRQIITLFNSRRYASVIQIIDLCKRELPQQIKNFFQFLRPVTQGFLHWEQFNHRDALKSMQKGIIQMDEYLTHYPGEDMQVFAAKTRQCSAALTAILEGTRDMTRHDFTLVADLLNNARRRMADRRYDDAAARVYRALELYGQISFEKTVGCATDKVKVGSIPEAIRDEFKGKYRESNGLLKLPMTATYKVLQAVGHDAGNRFFANEEKIKAIQHSRNYSILAHGIKPVNEPAANSIFATVAEFVQVKDFLDFPQL